MSAIDFASLMREERRKLSDKSSANALPSTAKKGGSSIGVIDFPYFCLESPPAVDFGGNCVGKIPTVAYVQNFVTEREAASICELVY